MFEKKSIYRMEMELEELKEKRDDLEQPKSGRVILVLLFGFLMVMMGTPFFVIMGFFVLFAGFAGIFTSNRVKREYEEDLDYYTERIRNLRNEIVEEKEAQGWYEN